MRDLEEVASSRDPTRRTGLGKEPMAPRDADPRHAKGAGRFLGEGRGGASSTSNGGGASSSRGKDVQGGASSSCTLPTKPRVPIMVEITDVSSWIGRKKVWPITEGGKLFSAPLRVPLNDFGVMIFSNMRPPVTKGWVEGVVPCEAFKKNGKDMFRFPNRDGMEPGVPSKKLRCSGCGYHRSYHEQVSAESVLRTLREAGSAPEDCSWFQDRIDDAQAYEPEMGDVQSSDEEADGEADGDSEKEAGTDLDGNSNKESRGYSSDDSEEY